MEDASDASEVKLGTSVGRRESLVHRPMYGFRAQRQVFNANASDAGSNTSDTPSEPRTRYREGKVREVVGRAVQTVRRVSLGFNGHLVRLRRTHQEDTSDASDPPTVDVGSNL